MTIDDLKNKLQPAFKKHNIEKAILFGSLARGEASRHSDIDMILVQNTSLRFLDRYDGGPCFIHSGSHNGHCVLWKRGAIEMKITYDPEVDALHLEFRHIEPGQAGTRQSTEEILADDGPDGKLAGLEIPDAQRVLAQTSGRVLFEIEPALATTNPG